MAAKKAATKKAAPAKKAAAKKVTGATSKTDSFTTASENPKSVTYGQNRRKAGATTVAAQTYIEQQSKALAQRAAQKARVRGSSWT